MKLKFDLFCIFFIWVNQENGLSHLTLKNTHSVFLYHLICSGGWRVSLHCIHQLSTTSSGQKKNILTTLNPLSLFLYYQFPNNFIRLEETPWSNCSIVHRFCCIDQSDFTIFVNPVAWHGQIDNDVTFY